jgi:translation initiation factor 5B
MFSDGRSIRTTLEHKFLVYRGSGLFEYVRGVDIKVSDYIVGLSSKYSVDGYVPVKGSGGISFDALSKYNVGLYQVFRKKVVRGDFKVYDFKTMYHNFVAEDLVIHNTSLLDKIRGTAVQLREAGGITQHIGASMFPRETLEAIAGDLMRRFRFELKVPGLLVIDTPGHEVFSNLRRRGGSAADIAILVVDINKGFQPQTHESMQILMSRKVPFLIAANKVDLLYGWKPKDTISILESLRSQRDDTLVQLEEKISYIISALNTYNFNADRFDRIKDFRKTVAIIPVSAKTGEGIKELITILVGLVQRFMMDRLMVDLSRPGYGVVLEVSREPGLGVVLKSIHLDGVIRTGDIIVTAGLEGVITSRIRSILMPSPLDEIRDPRFRFKPIDASYPASGIIISGPDLEGVIAGAPFYALQNVGDIDVYKNEVVKEVESIKVDTDTLGVILKADTLGSLEAMVEYVGRKGISIRKADVGPISKSDIVQASIVGEKDESLGAVLAFNVDILRDAEELARDKKVPIFSGKILYRIVDEYLAWVSEESIRKRRAEFESLIRPGKLLVLEGYIFRRSKPAIVGVRVLDGTIRHKYPLVRGDGKKVGSIHQIQDRGKTIDEATRDMEVAISVRDAVVGRDFDENDVLYVDVPEDHARRLYKDFSDLLRGDELNALRELTEIKRRSNPGWARY